MARIIMTKTEADNIIRGVVGDSKLLTASEVCKVLGLASSGDKKPKSKAWPSSLKSRGHLKLDDKENLYTKESLLKYMTNQSKNGRPMKRY